MGWHHGRHRTVSMYYRIVERRGSGGTYGPWQVVTDHLLVSLSDRENEIEFSATAASGADEAVACVASPCPLGVPQPHRHRFPPGPARGGRYKP